MYLVVRLCVLAKLRQNVDGQACKVFFCGNGCICMYVCFVWIYCFNFFDYRFYYCQLTPHLLKSKLNNTRQKGRYFFILELVFFYFCLRFLVILYFNFVVFLFLVEPTLFTVINLQRIDMYPCLNA